MPAAVVLAGGGPDPRLAPGLPNKAFLVMGGRPLVARVVGALRETPGVGPIVVVGPTAPLAALFGPEVETVPDVGTLMGNLSAALSRVPAAAQALAVASDLPLLSAAAVAAFLERCPPGADVCYPIVPQEAIEAAYPGARKTYVRTADGTFAGGSILLFRAGVIAQVQPLVEQILAARKRPWQLAQLFGWAMVMKFASGRLAVAELEARAREITGLVARAVVFPGPELALDVDAERPENLAVLRAALEGQGSG